jgi:hypothetical protein
VLAVDLKRCEHADHSEVKTYLSVIFSAPTAKPRDISPDLMAYAMFLIAMRPEEQSRLTVDIGTSSGIPAAIAAAREIYNGDGG